MNMWNVEICDVTLRDGEQTPGVAFTKDEKMAIARQLDAIGVEVIEAGFPMVSEEECKTVRAISRDGLDARICGLARAMRSDLEAAITAEVDMVSLFLATSPIHLQHKYKMPLEDMVARAVTEVDYAVDHGLQVRFGAEDASRTDVSALIRVYQEIAEHNATLVTFADTTGCLTPRDLQERLQTILPQISLPLAIHCHNDLGCATANTLTAAELGAFQLHTTVNGIGERCGNARLEEVLVGIRLKGGVDRYDLTEVPALSQMIAEYTGIPIPVTKPIVGDHAFAHESGIHIAAMLEDPRTYEYVEPALLGCTRKFLLGKHTGRKALIHVLSTSGYSVPDEKIDIILADIKQHSEGKGVVTPEFLTASIQKAIQGQ